MEHQLYNAFIELFTFSTIIANIISRNKLFKIHENNYKFVAKLNCQFVSHQLQYTDAIKLLH